jgi:hypothetical protein
LIIGKMRENIVENRGGSLKDIVVPIAKNTKAFTVYKCISLLVTPRVKMVATVYFNDNLFFEANEIQDVVLKWNLPTKFNACKAAMSQKLPHHFFGGSRHPPQRSRECAASPSDRTMVKSLRHRPLTRRGPVGLRHHPLPQGERVPE